jgi:predicted nicotinamide N-methyase
VRLAAVTRRLHGEPDELKDVCAVAFRVLAFREGVIDTDALSNRPRIGNLARCKQVLDLCSGQAFCSVAKRAGDRFQLIL